MRSIGKEDVVVQKTGRLTSLPPGDSIAFTRHHARVRGYHRTMLHQSAPATSEMVELSFRIMSHPCLAASHPRVMSARQASVMTMERHYHPEDTLYDVLDHTTSPSGWTPAIFVDDDSYATEDDD